MSNLLDTETLAAIKSALQDVVDTLFKTVITVNIQNVQLDKYDEGVTGSSTPHNFNCLSTYSVGTDGRYVTVKEGPAGQELHDAWRIYLWKQDLDTANVEIDPERDTCTLFGKSYHFRMFTPSAGFGELGNLLIELEIRFEKD